MLELLNATRKATQDYVKELGLKFVTTGNVTEIVNEDGTPADKEKKDSVQDFFAINNNKFDEDCKVFSQGSYTINKEGTGSLWIKTEKTAELDLNDAEVAWLKERFDENVSGEFFHFDEDVMDAAKALGVE